MTEAIEITVNVTQADIDAGQGRKCLSCPIALAIIRAMPGYTAYVRWTFARASTKFGITLRAGLPESAQTFMDRFDHGVPVEPISFPLTFVATS